MLYRLDDLLDDAHFHFHIDISLVHVPCSQGGLAGPTVDERTQPFGEGLKLNVQHMYYTLID